jgi:hypothetical protein
MAIFVVLALLGFVASMVVHASTFLPVPPLGMDQAWPLHVGIFLVFVPMVFAQKRQDRQDANASRSQDTDLARAPRWMRTLLGVVFAYAMLNFAVGMVLTSSTASGSVYSKDGRYVLAGRGAVELEAAPAEYVRQEARVARMFSGHWMLFYLASAAGLIDARRRARAEAADRRAAFLPPAARGSRYLLHPSPRLGMAAQAALMLLLSVALAGGCTVALVMF